MASEHLERRLTAILAADVTGYSRLTGLDEEGTHLQLRERLSSVVNPKIAEYRGRIVKNTGDGLLAEFSSAVDAVRCAIDVQRGMAKRNVNVAPEKRIDFRIGINIGDIIIDRGDIFGDGVNVAARLEGVADPGGICMSDDAFRQIQGRVAGDFVDLGEHQLKNIVRPVRIYQVRFSGGTAKTASSSLHKQSIAAAQSADGVPPAMDACKASPPLGPRPGPARLILAYAVMPSYPPRGSSGRKRPNTPPELPSQWWWEPRSPAPSVRLGLRSAAVDLFNTVRSRLETTVTYLVNSPQ